MTHYVFYCDDSEAGVAAADALRADTGADVVLYDVLACRDAEEADAVTFLPDVPDCERVRIEALFGIKGTLAAGSRAKPNRESAGHAKPDGLSVGKGPGGRYYVKRGKEILTGPYASEADARGALAAEMNG